MEMNDVEDSGEEDDAEDDDGSASSSSSSGDEDDEDEDDADEEADLELRRKIEEALRVNGISAATGDSDDESEEDLMDDDQMLAIDDKLAAAFKARAAEKGNRKGKCISMFFPWLNNVLILGTDVDAQREATHFKNRVLDLIDTFVRKQPTSALIIRLIMPLVELIVGTGPDEKQLADKATGILRNRIGKSKEIPISVATEDAAKTLEDLHELARKASTSDVLTTLNQCSLYLTKNLLHADVTGPVQKVYRESLHDFVARKSSKLNTAFFDDFVKRHSQAAWGIRDDLVKASEEALNVYRQMQAFHLLQTLVNHLPALVRLCYFYYCFLHALTSNR